MGIKASSAAAAFACAAIVICGLILGHAPADANVYATDLQWSAPAVNAGTAGASVDLTFRLNESADQGVTVSIYRADTSALVREAAIGPQTRGLHSWNWDLKDNGGAAAPRGIQYYFNVTAKDDGHAAWEQISSDSDQAAKFGYPRSVDVNKNPDSPYFGWVYVVSSYQGATVAPPDPQRDTTRGIYAMRSDFTDAIAQGDAARTGNVEWLTADFGVSPYKVVVGPESKVYLFDFSTDHGGVWVAPGNLSGNWVGILDGQRATVETPVGPNATHSCMAGGYIKGKGLDRTLYTVDEFLLCPTPDDTLNKRSKGSLWKYNIGALDQPYAQVPSIVWNDYYPSLNVNFESDLELDENNNWLMTQYRYPGNNDYASVWKLPFDGNPAGGYKPIWAVIDKPVGIAGVPSWGSTDALAGNRSGVAVDKARSRVALAGTIPGYIFILPTSLDQAQLTQFQLTDPAGDANPKDVAFDAAGNCYVSDNNIELVRAYSPPDGPNQFTTTSPGKFVPANGDATKPAAPVVTATPVAFNNTQLSANWTSTGTAYQYAIGVTADDQGIYEVNWTDTNNTSVTRTGLNLTTGVKYFFYVRAKSATGVWSDAGVSSGTLVMAPSKIGQAKASTPDTALAVVANVVVTKTGDGQFFVQESDRSAGIRVVSSLVPALGNRLTLSGTMGTAGPERFITASPADIQDNGACAEPVCDNTPVGLTQRGAGGRAVKDSDGNPPDKSQFGIYNDGLLVRVWGKVTDSDFISSFYLDDGSDVLNDSTTATGLKVDLSTAQVGGFPSPGQWMQVTGVLRLRQAGANVIAVLEPRDEADMLSL